MDEPTPDHYKALGLDNTADASTIKATYRKLVLKCHPDKVTDPALKEQKQEEFHNIQQAYECLIDQEKRSKYDALVKLEKLRSERAAARGAAPRDRTARFDVPTPGGASFAASGPTRYTTEHRAPTNARDEDERYYARYHTTPSKPTAASRSTREKESSKSSRHAKEDRSRSDREKTRAKESRSDRKFTSVDSESSSDEKARYEAAYKTRTEEEAARRRAEERRTYEDNRYAGAAQAVPAARKMSVQEQEALRYQHKSRAQVEEEMSSRPSPARASSRDYFNAEPRLQRRDSARPEPVRRSSARPGKERPSMTRRDTDRTDRGIPEVVEWADDRYEERRVPSFKQTTSSPADLARGMPQRSYTDRSTRHAENTPPSLSRSSTMPNSIPHVSSSSRRKESVTPRGPSNLRETMTSEQYSSPEKYASPERDAFPTVPPSSTVKTYYYPIAGGGVSAEAPSSTPRHVVREPTSRQHRSKSPIGKPPIGANRPTEPVAYKTVPRPTMPGRTDSSRTDASRTLSPSREDRGRSGRPKLYGEISGESQPRHRVRQSSIEPENVQYSRRYGPEDVRWAPRSSADPDRGYASKPHLSRTATYVY
ncbi:hypothetical protein GT037_003995 [Alternaria burnsii]|uniref:J domain-containing protein n=1 Tax=Alternaria burnsii TaxID=1187904 RepID=A0A8H7B7E5_9PLEO|nr:uncharacterized protein GT037_003995 [Alternaria burnsii]KAF7678614.1 hypothetical protein GT037_003995 [Alternaria burnsii]CAI9636862.1 unnamed protein product [Alternaria burnsii]